MSPAARSLQVFAAYLVGLGAGLVVAPQLLLAPFGIAAPQEVWIRVVGMLVLFVAGYYQVAARHEFLALMRLSVWTRGSVMVFFAAFVLLQGAPAALLLFAAVDLLGALWTAWALRQQPLPRPA